MNPYEAYVRKLAIRARLALAPIKPYHRREYRVSLVESAIACGRWLPPFCSHTENLRKLEQLLELVAVSQQQQQKEAMKDYISGKAEFQYPFAGDAKPAGGAQVLLLTEGGVCVRGTWDDSGAFHAWAPMPDADKVKQRLTKEKIAGLRR